MIGDGQDDAAHAAGALWETSGKHLSLRISKSEPLGTSYLSAMFNNI